MQQSLLDTKEEFKTLSIKPTKMEVANFFGYERTESLFPEIIPPQFVEIVKQRWPIWQQIDYFTYDWLCSNRCQRLPKPVRDLICEANGLPLHY